MLTQSCLVSTPFFRKTYSLCVVVEVPLVPCLRSVILGFRLFLKPLPSSLTPPFPPFALSAFTKVSQVSHSLFSSIHSHFFFPLFYPHPFSSSPSTHTPTPPKLFPFPHPKHSLSKFFIFGPSISKIVQKYKIFKEKHTYSIFTNFRFPPIFLFFSFN